MNLNKLIEHIPEVDNNELIELLGHPNFIVRSKTICEIAKRHLLSEDVKSKLRELKNDDTIFWNRICVRDFALAAMDVLGYEKYQGDDTNVKSLIDINLEL